MYKRLSKLILDASGVEDPSEERRNGFIDQLAADMKERLGTPILPAANETVAVTFKNRKTAALFFDRVWSPVGLIDQPPESIRVYGATELEVTMIAPLLCLQDMWDWPRVEAALRGTAIGEIWDKKIDSARAISEALSTSHGLKTTPVYTSVEDRNKEYGVGDKEVVLTAIDNFALVNEDKLDWEQVIEFRSDADSRVKYRKMIHWLDTEMIGKSSHFISDRIAIKLDEYEWCLRKHGIETVTGSLSSLLEPNFLVASTATITGLALTGDKFWAALGGAGLLMGKASLSLLKMKMDFAEKKRGKESEIAYVYEIKKKFNG